MTLAPVVRVAADQRTPFLDYCFDLLGRLVGIRFDVVDDSGPVDVYYGGDAARPCAIRIAVVEGYDRDTVPRPPSVADSEAALEVGAPFPFDVVAAVSFWLRDEGNEGLPAEAFDEHGRLLPSRSAQEHAGVREVPIVNAYAALLGEWVSQRIGVVPRSPFPAGKRCAVVLSHDVDSPFDPASGSQIVSLTVGALRHPRRAGPAALYGAGALLRAGRSRLRRAGGRHWLFEEIVAAEAAHGFASTFFFAATSRFDPNGHRRDVAYDVRREPFPALLRDLSARGVEIGLHIGYTVLDDPRSLRAERERLEAIVGAPVTGSRHHYWHMARPFWSSLDSHGSAGLVWDSSVSFNDAPGFRLGVSFPFRPWSPVHERPVAAIQVPPMAMDSQFLDPFGSVSPHALEHVSRLVEALKRVGGVAALDWHEYTSIPAGQKQQSLGRLYLAILDLLANDDEVLVWSYDEAIRLAA